MTPTVTTIKKEILKAEAALARLETQEREQAEGITQFRLDLRAKVESGEDGADEITAKIIAATAALASFRETKAVYQSVLDDKRHALDGMLMQTRTEGLGAAHTEAVAEVRRADDDFVTTQLASSKAMTRRERAIYKVNAIADRLRRLGVAVPARNFPVPALDAALMAADPAAAKATSFGTYPWRWVTIEIPVVNPDLRVPALELDDDADKHS